MTLRAYLREGKLKGRKMGVQWFVTEEAIRDYFNQEQEPAEAKSPATTTRPQLKYIVQGINDLVSETEECATIKETLDCLDRKSTRLNSSHVAISYAVFCLKKKKNTRPVR